MARIASLSLFNEVTLDEWKLLKEIFPWNPIRRFLENRGKIKNYFFHVEKFRGKSNPLTGQHSKFRGDRNQQLMKAYQSSWKWPTKNVKIQVKWMYSNRNAKKMPWNYCSYCSVRFWFSIFSFWYRKSLDIAASFVSFLLSFLIFCLLSRFNCSWHSIVAPCSTSDLVFLLSWKIHKNMWHFQFVHSIYRRFFALFCIINDPKCF